MSGPRSAARLRKRATDAAIVTAFKAGWQAGRYLPDRTTEAAFRTLADRLWQRHAADVHQLERNLARVHPQLPPEEVRLLSRDALRSYMRYWQEAFALPYRSPSQLNDAFTMENPEVADAVIGAGQGLILVATHSGNWDMSGAWGAARYGSVTTVAERLRPEALFREFVKHREAFGAEILATGDPSAMDVLADRLSDGRLVALMGDRDISRRGVPVELFGSLASFPTGPARLAVDTGAALHTVDLWYAPDGARARIGPRIPVPSGGDRHANVLTVTQAIATAFETSLAAHSVDWHMMQPVWLEDLDRTRRASRQP